MRKSKRFLFALLLAAGPSLLSPPVTQAQYLTLGFEFSGLQNIVDKASLAGQRNSVFGVSAARFIDLGGVFLPELRIHFLRRKADTIGYGISNIDDISLLAGGRLLPGSPLFRLGSTAVGFTLSGMGGFSWLWATGWSTLPQFTALLTAGLTIHVGYVAAFMVEFVYRPMAMEMPLKDGWDVLAGTLSIEPSWCIRVGWIF